ncbi:uncharacterized mitochondrial protein AtMg00820-like [Carya illinoinensis]|uniref:uncharacterized mitochondrial protein AtMg00820-like n=1 Tax=Carya illinoinensis TaxID=32201 RepID=UPI001C725512|nr:uncharacterized mitochondrial protein AtMg00820-like [Carya illinoinensis]
MITHSKSLIHCPIQRSDGIVPWLPQKLALPHIVSALSIVPEEPSYYIEAFKFLEWCIAMNIEFQALLKTWDLVPASSQLNVLGSKWVLKMKWHADGSLERCRACLVSKGFHHQAVIDYIKAFSKSATIRLLISLAVQNQWPFQQLDV